MAINIKTMAISRITFATVQQTVKLRTAVQFDANLEIIITEKK